MFNHVFWFLSFQSTEVTCHVEILKEGLSSLLCWRRAGEGEQAPFPAEDSATWLGYKSSPSPRGLTRGLPHVGLQRAAHVSLHCF